MYEFSCDQCDNRIRVYVEVTRTVTGLPMVFCYRSIAHKRNAPRRMTDQLPKAVGVRSTADHAEQTIEELRKVLVA